MRRFLTVVAAVGLCASAYAQTKISGTAQFSKPDPVHMIPVGDRAGHSLGVEQQKCTWTKPLDFSGDKAKDGASTETLDISGAVAKARGFHVGNTEGGDKFFVWYQGTSTLKDGQATEVKGAWGFSGGTGKLKGLKGKGTYSCAPSGDGQACDIEGEYQLAK